MLVNGFKTMMTIFGCIGLSPNMELFNVLYVLNLTCNLISIHQLISQINCQIMFTNELCVIKDAILRALIGSGEIRGGLLLHTHQGTFDNEGWVEGLKYGLVQTIGTSVQSTSLFLILVVLLILIIILFVTLATRRDKHVSISFK